MKHSDLPRLLLITALCLLFFLTKSMTIHLLAQCPLPGSVNLVQNFSFENIAPPPADCSFTSGQKNDAFNGCAANWVTGVGTPSLCNAITFYAGPGSSPIINAPEGIIFGCLGSSTSASGVCANESIVESVNLCQGVNYILSFQYNNLLNFEGTGTLSVLLTTAAPSFCAPVNSLNDIVIQIPISQAVLPPNTAPAWVTVSVPIPSTLLTNTQLVFVVNPPTNNSRFDVGIDNISITCQQPSALIPQISAVNNDNNSFIFSGSTIPNGGVANWCWDFGDGSTATGQTVTHSYAQIGNPQVCLTITDNCGCTRTVCQNVAYETCHCAEQSLILTPGIQYYSGPDLVGQDIIVPPGTHLIISGRTLSIKNSCKFVVLRGASLVVDNSTLTNYCNDQKWQGIVVWGNSTVPHQGHTNIPQSSASDPGIAVIQGNSHINYARTALEPQRWWSDSRNNAFFAAYPGSITNYWGGIVIGKGGSEFLNNRKSADIGTYPYTNLSSFTDCTFNSSTSDPGNGTGAEGVNIWNTNGVTFTQCNFNSIPARGITTINAAITVTKSLFTKNYQGILAGTTSTFTAITRIGTGTLTDQNTFTENKFGVSADAASLLQIWTNIFSKNAFSGFRASSYANFSVRGNYFERNDKGITLMNTGAAGQEILCNTHQDDNWGIFASADCRGATFRKNKYDNKVADVLLQGINGISGQFPNQIFAANDASPFNYFSEHESDNDIVTEAPTNSFLYFPPFQNLVPIPAEIPRTLPDCDSDDFGCTMNYNFQNAPYVNGGFNCIINPLGDAPCIDRNCLDSLRSRLAWLQQQATLQEQYKSEMQGTERRFLSDKRVLLEQWFSDGNMTLIEQTLGTYGQVDDKQLLYGFYLRQKNLSQGAAVLASLPSNTTEDVWFKSVQNIYLNYLAASTTPYVATHAQDSLLETVGTSIQPVGANARAVYYLLHGIWLEPVIDAGDRQSIVKAEIPEAKTLLLIPNPANNKVRVRLPATDGTLRVFDLFGKLQQAITVSSIDMELDTVILNNGIYLLHYTALDGSHTQARLVIRH